MLTHAHVLPGDTVGLFCARHGLSRQAWFHLNPHKAMLRTPSGHATAMLVEGERLRVFAETIPDVGNMSEAEIAQLILAGPSNGAVEEAKQIAKLVKNCLGSGDCDDEQAREIVSTAAAQGAAAACAYMGGVDPATQAICSKIGQEIGGKLYDWTKKGAKWVGGKLKGLGKSLSNAYCSTLGWGCGETMLHLDDFSQDEMAELWNGTCAPTYGPASGFGGSKTQQQAWGRLSTGLEPDNNTTRICTNLLIKMEINTQGPPPIPTSFTSVGDYVVALFRWFGTRHGGQQRQEWLDRFDEAARSALGSVAVFACSGSTAHVRVGVSGLFDNLSSVINDVTDLDELFTQDDACERDFRNYGASLYKPIVGLDLRTDREIAAEADAFLKAIGQAYRTNYANSATLQENLANTLILSLPTVGMLSSTQAVDTVVDQLMRTFGSLCTDASCQERLKGASRLLGLNAILKAKADPTPAGIATAVTALVTDVTSTALNYVPTSQAVVAVQQLMLEGGVAPDLVQQGLTNRLTAGGDCQGDASCQQEAAAKAKEVVAAAASTAGPPPAVDLSGYETDDEAKARREAEGKGLSPWAWLAIGTGVAAVGWVGYRTYKQEPIIPGKPETTLRLR